MASDICHGLSEWRCCGRKCVLRSLQCCDTRSEMLMKVTRSFAQPASFLRQATHLNRRCTTQEHEVSVTGQHDVLHIACCRAFTAFPESLTSSTSWGSSLVITNLTLHEASPLCWQRFLLKMATPREYNWCGSFTTSQSMGQCFGLCGMQKAPQCHGDQTLGDSRLHGPLPFVRNTNGQQVDRRRWSARQSPARKR